MSNPVDEFLAMKKEANLGQLGKMVGGEVGKGMLQAAGGAMIVGLAGAAMKAFQAAKKRRSFQGMMEHNPDLQEFQREDPQRFNAHYNSLHGMNPEFAQDPIVSGTYMRQMSLSPQTAGTTIVQSLESKQRVAPWSVGVSMMRGPEVGYRF